MGVIDSILNFFGYTPENTPIIEKQRDRPFKYGEIVSIQYKMEECVKQKSASELFIDKICEKLKVDEIVYSRENHTISCIVDDFNIKLKLIDKEKKYGVDQWIENILDNIIDVSPCVIHFMVIECNE